MDKWSKLTLMVPIALLLGLIMVGVVHAGDHPANSMWIEPSEIDVTGMSVGDRFNVTVWLNVSVNCGAWQFYLIYNKQQLNVTKYGLTGTGGARSQFFENTGTATWGMVSSEGDHNATHKYIMIGESWKSGPFGTGAGSLAWIEFEIKTQPPEGGELTSILDIASGHHPPTSDTCALDPNMKEIPLNVWNTPIIPEFNSIVLMIALLGTAAICILLRKK
jgi:hypothetical protein